ncbi:MAG: hypothetical protein ACFE7R_11300 [Candidatus Hodarchaeota archaeon]
MGDPAKECAHTITPGASEMGLDSSSVPKSESRDTRLVRGCPCYKEFGNEKVCLNKDDVLPINAISVDPMFFSEVTSAAQLFSLRSDNPSMCYLLIYLDHETERTYCVSQGRPIKINSRTVQPIEIQAALHFVTTTAQASDGVICSACLYKYLMTLGEAFEDVLTKDERAHLITTFLKDLTSEVAVSLLDANTQEDIQEEMLENKINERISELMKRRANWASISHDLKQEGSDERLIALVDHYRVLARLEAIFLFQVSTLREADHGIASLGFLKFMIDVAERIMRLIDEIRETTHTLENSSSIPGDLSTLLEQQHKHRQEIEVRFNSLLKLLNQIETRTDQKPL